SGRRDASAPPPTVPTSNSWSHPDPSIPSRTHERVAAEPLAVGEHELSNRMAVIPDLERRRLQRACAPFGLIAPTLLHVEPPHVRGPPGPEVLEVLSRVAHAAQELDQCFVSRRVGSGVAALPERLPRRGLLSLRRVRQTVDLARLGDVAERLEHAAELDA